MTTLFVRRPHAHYHLLAILALAALAILLSVALSGHKEPPRLGQRAHARVAPLVYV